MRERPTEDPTGAVSGLADATGRFLPFVGAAVGAAIVEAFAARDPESTGALVRGHIQAAHHALVTLMAESTAGAA